MKIGTANADPILFHNSENLKMKMTMKMNGEF